MFVATLVAGNGFWNVKTCVAEDASERAVANGGWLMSVQCELWILSYEL